MPILGDNVKLTARRRCLPNIWTVSEFHLIARSRFPMRPEEGGGGGLLWLVVIIRAGRFVDLTQVEASLTAPGVIRNCLPSNDSQIPVNATVGSERSDFAWPCPSRGEPLQTQSVGTSRPLPVAGRYRRRYRFRHALSHSLGRSPLQVGAACGVPPSALPRRPPARPALRDRSGSIRLALQGRYDPLVEWSIAGHRCPPRL